MANDLVNHACVISLHENPRRLGLVNHMEVQVALSESMEGPCPFQDLAYASPPSSRS